MFQNEEQTIFFDKRKFHNSHSRHDYGPSCTQIKKECLHNGDVFLKFTNTNLLYTLKTLHIEFVNKNFPIFLLLHFVCKF